MNRLSNDQFTRTISFVYNGLVRSVHVHQDTVEQVIKRSFHPEGYFKGFDVTRNGYRTYNVSKIENGLVGITIDH